MKTLMPEGLAICPVGYIELAPAFLGDRRRQDEFLLAIGIDLAEGWTSEDTQSAHQGWMRQITLKRKGQGPKRPVADIVIGWIKSLSLYNPRWGDIR